MTERPFKNFIWDIIFARADRPEDHAGVSNPISVVGKNFEDAIVQARQLTPPSGYVLIAIKISQGIRTPDEVTEIERTQPAAPVW